MIQVEIMITGQLDRHWSDWFSGFEITHSAANSTLKGPIRDQSELRGILSRLADLGLDLISVNTLPGSHSYKRPEKGGSEYRTNNNDL